MICEFLLRHGCQYGSKVKSICGDIGWIIARAAWRKIDIVLKRDFDHVHKIDIILKTNEYCQTKFGQYKKPYVLGFIQLCWQNLYIFNI